MKKLISVLILGMMCLCLVGCGGEANKAVSTTRETAETERRTTASTEETEEAYETRSPEEEAEFERKRAESLVTYADMVTEIQTDIPELEITGIMPNEDGGNSLSIKLQLQESKDATYYILAELTALKETLMNNNDITSITATVYNQDEIEGFILFNNEGGRYEPTVNTL